MADQTTVGGYLLGEQIGRGGMGSVYRAHQPSVGRTVAIKLMHPQLASDPGVVARFRTEAVAGGRLSHPNVAGVIDFGTTPEGTRYLVMEHVAGERLSSLLEQEGSFPVRRACDLARQILSALGAAHAADVVHADVKCDNVIVTTTPEGIEVATLIDFGIARLIDEPLPSAPGERILSGTPEYLAPEVIAGAPSTPASDLYAVGIVLYELLTGATPFRDDAPTAVFQHHLQDQVVPPSLRCPEAGISPALDRVVLRALAKDPALRHRSAASFTAALVRAMPAQESTRVRRPSVFSTQSPTLDWPTPTLRRVALGTRPQSAERLAQLRSHVGAAIVDGDTEAIAAAYLELARALVAENRLDLASWELEQAVDLLTGGDGPETASPPPPLWHVLLALASLYDGLGDLARARTAARQGTAAARHASSAAGCARGSELLQRLWHERDVPATHEEHAP